MLIYDKKFIFWTLNGAQNEQNLCAKVDLFMQISFCYILFIYF